MKATKYGYADKPSKCYDRLIRQYVKHWMTIKSRHEKARLNAYLGLTTDQAYNLRNGRLKKPVDVETQNKIWKLLNEQKI